MAQKFIYIVIRNLSSDHNHDKDLLCAFEDIKKATEFRNAQAKEFIEGQRLELIEDDDQIRIYDSSDEETVAWFYVEKIELK